MKALSPPQQPFFARLSPVWREARRALDKHGSQYRGRIRAQGLDSRVASCLYSLVGRFPRQELPLSALERVLADKGVGDNLDEALVQLGFPSMSPVERAALDKEDQELSARKQRATAKLRKKQAVPNGAHQAPATPKPQATVFLSRDDHRRETLAGAVASWTEPWVDEWVERVISSEADLTNVWLATECARKTRVVLDLLDSDRKAVFSKADVAVRLFGNAHALDGGLLQRFVHFALQCRLGQYHLPKSELWEKAGIKSNYLYSPALSWRIPATDHTPLGEHIRSANQGNLPVYITQYALSRGSLEVPRGTRVLVVENPRFVEAAVERNLPICVISTNGNPGNAFRDLLRQLFRTGADIWFHTDFDTAGFLIGKFLHKEGCEPWGMSHRDYIKIIRWAKKEGIPLPRQGDPRSCPPLPWDAALHSVYQTHRLVIHQELVLDEILDGFALHANHR